MPKNKLGPTIKRVGGTPGKGKLPKGNKLKPVVIGVVSVYRPFTGQSIIDSMGGK